MKLIDRDVLVAEIEKRIRACGNCYILDELTSLHCTFNSLEVKEIDLKKEINTYISNNFFGSETIGFYANRTKEEPNDQDIALCAKYFFELGLKAQHDSWKVVDNTNLPQADRNKIYCVLSKNKYLLARVINHPQDEELLQWKCVEFPFHRYDMCEGDRYMQIV